MPATDEYFRDVKKTHVVFACSAVVLFVATLWMMADDHTAEWRAHQQTMDKLDKAKLRAKEQELKTARFASPDKWQENVANLKTDIKTAQDKLSAADSKVPELQQALDEQLQKVDLKTREVRDVRAFRDVDRANYDLAIRDRRPSSVLTPLKAQFDARQQQVEQLEQELEVLEAQAAEISGQLAQATRRRDELNSELIELTGSVEQANAALAKIDPAAANPDSFYARFSSAKRAIMDWPIIDGFNSPHKIVNDWLPNLNITLGMAKTARFDRCRTCHQGIDRIEDGGVPAFPLGHPESDDLNDWLAENSYPHPYATHPRPDLFVTSSSPHPAMDGPLKFGCTICHDGNGSGTSFQNAEHGPNDPHEAEQWAEQHGYHSNHFWEYPMLPERFIESGCIKCHHNVVELGVHPEFGASAPKVHRGYQLITKYGCFGCHEIHGYDAGKSIGPDLRLEPQTAEEASKNAEDSTQVAGKMRKVGPSLNHIASKTTGGWIEYWTEAPQRFRPNTRMPQFYHLSNQHDETAERLMPIELAGIAEYLLRRSEDLELDSPAEDYQPNPERGKELFATRGCLACHSHKEFPETSSDFGPDLTPTHEKIRPGQDGFNWVYTWVRDPERHHPRTKMPNVFLDPYQQEDETVDPAADIAAFLLQGGAKQYPRTPFAHSEEAPNQSAQAVAENNSALDELVRIFLVGKVLTKAQTDQMMESKRYPIPSELIKGDEIELAQAAGGDNVSDEEWTRMKLSYVGRRTISRYGCYGCHDIPGFETARPIGTALQDWGRKDTSRLAIEHIGEYLHHHGEPDGSSTTERVHATHLKMEAGGAKAGEFASEEEQEQELSAAYFYENLLHHGRPGFIWQKLREPRSYDYLKTETKGYDERLRMPKFPFSEEDIEAVATFVLGLVAEPPPGQYLYRPDGPAGDRIEGERLLEKYNCAGCHMLDMPEIRFAMNPDNFLLPHSEPAAGDHPEGLEMMLKMKPPRNGLTGEQRTLQIDGEEETASVISFHGLIYGRPDPDFPIEDQEFYFDTWETVNVGEKQWWPGTRITVPKPRLAEEAMDDPNGYYQPGRGGPFAEFLVDYLQQQGRADNPYLAWQMSPPPLYQEGFKVQTPWLYQFLKEPERIRQVTVLRMPKFNLDDDEARALANYFAAHDGVPYPYQQVDQRESDYLAAMNAAHSTSGENDYLAESWNLLNANICIGCHAVGGREFRKPSDPKQVQGPDLKHTVDRLRPDWLLLWLYKPQWITPYTSMPQPFGRNQQQFPELFGGDPQTQTIAIRDALMNYHRLMESRGKTIYPSATAAAGDGVGDTGNEGNAP